MPIIYEILRTYFAKRIHSIQNRSFLVYYNYMNNRHIKNNIKVINIEVGNPDTQTAINHLKNELMTFRRQNIKAAIVIHGYGSSGTGGTIKSAVKKLVSDNSMRGIIRDHSEGDKWVVNKKRMVSTCPDLAKYESNIQNNPGVTIVILRKF